MGSDPLGRRGAGLSRKQGEEFGRVRGGLRLRLRPFDAGTQAGGERGGFAGALQVFRPSLTLEEDVRDTEMIDATRDEVAAHDPGQRVGAIDDGPGNAGERDGERHGAGADQRGATGRRTFGDGTEVDALGLLAVFRKETIKLRVDFAPGVQDECPTLRVVVAEKREGAKDIG